VYLFRCKVSPFISWGPQDDYKSQCVF
jgi:hypothetical protein